MTPSPSSPFVKHEPKIETFSRVKPDINEPPISAAELNEQRTEAFQLQNLLKDAGLQMLESAVEQGVKLLDQIKIPLDTTFGQSSDSQQWTQQIGKTLSNQNFTLLT